MEVFYGVIYYRNGTSKETGTFSGPGAEQSCERHTMDMFDRDTRMAISDYFKPTRYVVKSKNI